MLKKGDEYKPARDGNGVLLGHVFLVGLFTPLPRLFSLSPRRVYSCEEKSSVRNCESGV